MEDRSKRSKAKLLVNHQVTQPRGFATKRTATIMLPALGLNGQRSVLAFCFMQNISGEHSRISQKKCFQKFSVY